MEKCVLCISREGPGNVPNHLKAASFLFLQPLPCNLIYTNKLILVTTCNTLHINCLRKTHWVKRSKFGFQCMCSALCGSLWWCTNLCSKCHSLLWKACRGEVTGHICHSPLQQVLAHLLLLHGAGWTSGERQSETMARERDFHQQVISQFVFVFSSHRGLLCSWLII